MSLLHGRPQGRTLNFMSITFLSSNDESEASDTPAEVEADSPCSNLDESPTSRAKAGLMPMTRGRVSKLKQTSSGVTNALNPILLTNYQKRSHQQNAAKVPEVPLDQLSQAKTKETLTNAKDNEDTKCEATDEASHTM